LTVEINARDIALLREFQRITPYYSGVTERIRSTNFAEASRTAVWSLCSLAARIKLRDLGLPCGRKSKKITPPQAEFSPRDYLRGVIDADGSVGHTRQGIPFVSLSTSSTGLGAYWCFYAGKITGAERHTAGHRWAGSGTRPVRMRQRRMEQLFAVRPSSPAAALSLFSRSSTRSSCAVQ
jgi:hypothetical protein